MITVSIVSHGHGAMVQRLVDQLLSCVEVRQVIVTLNIPESLRFSANANLELVQNTIAKGFGTNHNAAFLRCRTPLFCVLNPDIELRGNPFPELIRGFQQVGVGLVAPLIVNPLGGLEDSVRHFPRISSLARKLLGTDPSQYHISPGDAAMCPDWVAGMFLLFRTPVFKQVKGFDEAYFLYYEDVDICVRLWIAGIKILVFPGVTAVHDARRQSRANWQHRRWHLQSMGRYFYKYLGRLPHTVPANHA